MVSQWPSHLWWVVYLSPADKYHSLTRRLSQGQKGLDERLSWPPSSPLPSGDALDIGHADARRLLRPPHLAASHPVWSKYSNALSVHAYASKLGASILLSLSRFMVSLCL